MIIRYVSSNVARICFLLIFASTFGFNSLVPKDVLVSATIVSLSSQ